MKTNHLSQKKEFKFKNIIFKQENNLFFYEPLTKFSLDNRKCIVVCFFVF